jgi:hypothetical protein
MFLGKYLNQLSFLWCPVTENSSIFVHWVRSLFVFEQREIWLPKYAALKN